MMKNFISNLRDEVGPWLKKISMRNDKESIQLAGLIRRLDDGLRRQQELIEAFESQFKEMTRPDEGTKP